MKRWQWCLVLPLFLLPCSRALITSSAINSGSGKRSEALSGVVSSLIERVRGRKPRINRRPRVHDLEDGLTPTPRKGDMGHHIREFFRSARSASWATFSTFWVFLTVASYLLYSRQDLKYWWQHIFSMCFWIFMAVVYLGIVDAQSPADPDAVDDWLDGYIVELILSMENIFLYEIILVSFRVPPKLSRKILFVTSFCQMFWQMWLFMFVASYLQDIKSLPYLLGAWLIYIGVASLREDDHGSFDPEHSDLFRMLRTGFGSRLLPHYPHDGSMLQRDESGKLCVTMLLPVTACIIIIMLVMEVDVTLAKIETIDSHFIAWTSSVLVAFALPDLYVIVSELFKQFYLMRTGISVLLLFFGGLLLVREEVQVSDTTEVAVMLTIVFGSIILSTMMHMGPKHGAAYDESEEEDSEPSSKVEREVHTNAEATLYSLY
mmetsp:Transcript_27583/g.56875  ORF Transcript_27583/g.56875 Transcript_27583/m.56875 type:complete len:433 (-) Transcript_27583:18-1316(-)